MGIALIAALAIAGCGKKEESAEQQSSTTNTATTTTNTTTTATANTQEAAPTNTQQASVTPPAAPPPAGGELHIFNWGDYTNPDLIKKFEAKYNVKVTLTDYDSNDAMLAKV